MPQKPALSFIAAELNRFINKNKGLSQPYGQILLHCVMKATI